jgi:hypothetical protein
MFSMQENADMNLIFGRGFRKFFARPTPWQGTIFTKALFE